MPRLASLLLALIVATLVADARAEMPSGDANRGALLFRACTACHSLAPDRNMTGPSLAGIWGRKAGSLESFERYSPALEASNAVGDEKPLDEWLKSPPRLIPDNRMIFAGISDTRQRRRTAAGRRRRARDGGHDGRSDLPV